jgi:hypothetical protein
MSYEPSLMWTVFFVSSLVAMQIKQEEEYTMNDAPEHIIPVKGGYIKESEFLEYVDYKEMMICSECYEPYGFWTYRPEIIDYLPHELNPTKSYFQKCHRECSQYNLKPQMLPEVTKQDKWPGFDFNERVTLCHACGQEIRLSGSRFSYWFCRTCLGRAMYFNSQHAPVIVPQGRHSSMAGFVLPGMDSRNEEKIKDFVQDTNRLVRSIDHLEKWRRFVMETNFKILGISCDVRLDYYLVSAYNDRLKFEAWGELCNFMKKKYKEDGGYGELHSTVKLLPNPQLE